MSKLTTAAALAAILAASSAAIAKNGPPPTTQVEHPILACPRGYAATFVVQCDPAPSSANPLARLTNPAEGVHVVICTAAPVSSCQPIANFNPNARPGHEVLDSAGGGLAVLSTGLDRLLGVAP
jgi:hypothetical protein